MPKTGARGSTQDERGDELRQGEMFGAECGEWGSVKNRPEENQLVETSRLLPTAAKKNHDQADSKNDATDKIRPEYFAGNCDDDCRRMDDVDAHDGSFR